jgi:trimethylamine--corrinoid protein Co-methyltransferase
MKSRERCMARYHTLKHFRDVRYSNLFERMVYEKWKETGAKTFEQRLQESTLAKMKHRPRPLPDDVVRELDKMQANGNRGTSER